MSLNRLSRDALAQPAAIYVASPRPLRRPDGLRRHPQFQDFKASAPAEPDAQSPERSGSLAGARVHGRPRGLCRPLRGNLGETLRHRPAYLAQKGYRRGGCAGGLCERSGSGPATSTRPGPRRSRGWRPLPATARSTWRASAAMCPSTRPRKPCRSPIRPCRRWNSWSSARRCSGSTAVSTASSPSGGELVRLAYLNGMSREELAGRFGHPAGTIKTWLHRSLKQLKDCLGA